MLNKFLLNQFTQASPASRVMCRRAWPSISSESKLQIIESYQSTGDLPFWLLELALGDKAEIVRIWCMKTADIEVNGLVDKDLYIQIYGEKEYKEKLEIYTKTQNDSSDLVRDHVGRNYFNTFIDFTTISQDSRLIRIRHMLGFSHHMFIKLFDEIYQKLSKEDLIECLDEIIENLDKYWSLQIDIETLEEGWKLASTVNENVASRLVKILPIQANNKWIKAELMLELPPLAKFWVLKTNEKIYTQEIIRFIKVIIENRESYDKYIYDLAVEILLDAEPNYWNRTSVSEAKPTKNIFLIIIRNIKKYFEKP